MVEPARIMPISWGGDRRAVDGADYGAFWQPLEILLRESVVHDVRHAMRGEGQKTKAEKLWVKKDLMRFFYYLRISANDNHNHH